MSKPPECPHHKRDLVQSKTSYGIRYSCPVRGCTVACWSGDTSTPADAATREARQKAHAALERLWNSGRFKRGYVYSKLARVMGKRKGDTHVGMFNRAECLFVERFVQAILEGKNV